jgi:hypothetical protein
VQHLRLGEGLIDLGGLPHRFPGAVRATRRGLAHRIASRSSRRGFSPKGSFRRELPLNLTSSFSQRAAVTRRARGGGALQGRFYACQSLCLP